MRRKILVVAFVLIFMISVIPAFGDEGVQVSLNGNYVAFTSNTGIPFIDASNRTQVPFRQSLEEFGAIVNWDQNNRTAIAERNGIEVKVPIGADYIFKNGVKIPNDTAALIKDGRTYLPIRAVLEAFGADVKWNSAEQTVSATSDLENNIMSIHFIDVGQADSIFIDFGTYEILIDAGNNSDGNSVVNYMAPYLDGNLELIVATHAHADHVGGLDTVINAYQVDKIIYSDETSSTITFNDFYNAAANEPNCTFIGDSDMTIDMGNGAQIKILEMGEGNSDSNQNSVISMIDYNNVETLLMGDLDSAYENKNLSKFIDVDVLKAGHHGSYTASGQSFLNITKPECVIISAGKDNQYGHPHKETLERFFAMGANVYGTFKNGSIVMRTDGNAYNINPSTMLSLSDIAASTNNIIYTPPTTNNDTSTQNEASYIGNANTHKFHYASCRYVSSMNPENMVYLKLRSDAIKLGYIPCLVCKP